FFRIGRNAFGELVLAFVYAEDLASLLNDLGGHSRVEYANESNHPARHWYLHADSKVPWTFFAEPTDSWRGWGPPAKEGGDEAGEIGCGSLPDPTPNSDLTIDCGVVIPREDVSLLCDLLYRID